MGVIARLWDSNLWKAVASNLSADSAESLAGPIRYTLDQLRSKAWRSQGPWVVVAGWNDKLDVTRTGLGPGVFVVTLTPGIYTSASAFATMVQAAMNAADSGGLWVVTYNTSTRKFTIDSPSGSSITFLVASGANVATTGYPDMGFPVAAGDVGGVPATGSVAVSQGRHFLAVDLGSSIALTCAQALRHNLSGGTIKLKTSNTSVLDALTAGNSDTLSLTDLTTLRATAYAYLTRTARYAAFLIEDQGNTAGYSEIGVPYVGTFRQFTVQYSNRFGELGDDLSEIVRATDGAQFVDVRAEAREWTLEWADISSASGDLASFQAFRTGTPKGVNFFLDLDQSKASALFMVYVFRPNAMPIPTTSGDYYSPSFNVAEALG